MEVWIVTRTEYNYEEVTVTIDGVFSNITSAASYCDKKTLQEGGWRHAPTYDYELHYIED
jgi:hypothetical protein